MKLLETMRGYSRKRKFFTSIVALIVLDQLFVWVGHGILLRNDVDFEARWERANIDLSAFSRRSDMICEFEHVLLIYGYQTCFEPKPNSVYPDRAGYSFVYSKPRSKFTLWFRGDYPGNYYFEVTFGKTLKYVRVDGVILESPGAAYADIRIN